MRTLPEAVWRRIIDDYLRRSQSPLSPDDWELVDQVVAEVAASLAVCRRFIPLFAMTRPGIQVVGAEELAGARREPECLELPMIHWDFTLSRSQVRQGASAILEAAAEAAATCILAEDNLILHGHPGLGHQGLFSAAGRLTLPLTQPHDLLREVLRAVQYLADHGCAGPCALVLNPALAGPAHRQEMLGQVCIAGVHLTELAPADQAAVISVDPGHLDLAISQEMVTAYLESDKTDHRFRVFEMLALRIKRPDAICTLEPLWPA